jgi:hypothetical protein
MLPVLSDVSQMLSGRRLLIHAGRTVSNHLDIELFLGHLFARAGAEVMYLYDDGMLRHWDTWQIRHNEYLTPYRYGRWPTWIHEAWVKPVFRAFRHERLHLVPYSAVSRDDRELLELDAIERRHALSSTMRYFERLSVDPSRAEEKTYYEESLYNSRLTKTLVHDILLRDDIDLLFSSHGIYSVWAPPLRVAERMGVPSLVWAIMGVFSWQIVLLDVNKFELLKSEHWKAHQARTLSASEKQHVIDYLESRTRHEAADTKLYYKNANRTRRRWIHREPGTHVFGIFPNVVWDGNVPERDTLFDGPLAWLQHTIESFIDNPNRLVIRFHPSEATKQAGTQRLEELIYECMPYVPEMKNVDIVGPEENLDTYQFIRDNIDVGLVYDGTLALELPYLGVPVLAGTTSRYTSDDFNFHASDKEQYQDYLRDPEPLIREFRMKKDEILEALYKYMHWFFFKTMYELPILSPDMPEQVDYENVLRLHEKSQLDGALKAILERVQYEVAKRDCL